MPLFWQVFSGCGRFFGDRFDVTGGINPLWWSDGAGARMLLFGSWLVDCRRVEGVVLGLAKTFGGLWRGGYRHSGIVKDAWFADAFAFDGLHGLVHIDMELVAGPAAIDFWLIDGIAGTWSGYISGVVTRCSCCVGVGMLQKIVVLPVVFLGFFEFAWVGLGILAVVRGFARATDLGLEGHILVLPFHHGLLSFECRIVKGIIGK